ncbi:hypothetical protein [Lacinutrix undariae]
MVKIKKYDFCDVEIHKNYLIVSVNEAIVISPSHNQTLFSIINTHYKNTNFIYISNRKNSYSVDPLTYLETNNIPNLIGFSIVSSNYRTTNNAEIEKLFSNKPYSIFASIKEATHWADVLIKTY